MATSKTRKPRQPSAPKDETKAQKFVRLAEARLAKAVKMVRNIAKLGGSGYERTEAQAKYIADTLTAEVTAMKTRLAPGQAKKEEAAQFKLPT